MMRNGLTLIELILSMVIIAVVFTVVPKIIFASNKTLQLSVKEDGMYNAIALLGSISKLPWDENTIDSNGTILIVNNECNTTSGYKVGGFIGSRNCIGNNLTQSITLGQEIGEGSNEFDDIDDFHNQTDFSETSSSGKDYDLNSSVAYEADPNIKKITVSVKGGPRTGNFQTSFFYYSANLGHTTINKRAW
jgi:prepilin-type N-terminal cleavage/methylation domain-containing protein